METTYQITYYARIPDESGNFMLQKNLRRIGSTVRPYRRALKIVKWLRRRNVMAFMF